MTPPLSLALAVVLITDPSIPMEKEDAIFEKAFVVVPFSYIQRVGVHLEILDEKEVPWLSPRKEEFLVDMKLFRRRYREVCDAPPLHDMNRFPDISLCGEVMEYNRKYRHWLEVRKALFPDETWCEEAIAECDWLWGVWDCVRTVKCEYYYIMVRRRELKQLREKIGEVAYYSGLLPPPVPVWRFQKID